jgi:hypothetical protein
MSVVSRGVQTLHLNDGYDLAYCKSDVGPLTAAEDETTCAECLRQMEGDMPHQKYPQPAIDEGRLVHLTWLRRNVEIHTSLCSSVVAPILVIPCEQEYPTCLRCIDVVSRFW